MHKRLLLFFLLPSLASCKLTKNEYTAWRYPNRVTWPEKRIPRKAETTVQTRNDSIGVNKTGNLYASASSGVPALHKEELTLSTADAENAHQKTEALKNKLIQKIESSRRFKKLSSEKQDTVLHRIQNLPPDEFDKQFVNADQDFQNGDVKHDKMALASIILACLCFTPPGFALLFFIPAIILGAKARKRTTNSQSKKEATAGMIIGIVLPAIAAVVVIVVGVVALAGLL
jgi:hypothetical protein